ncbi:hypothetical protein BLS_008296 [Venturia inaequalis]|uniref:Uncharacterized protein n=1 Tax=Venturia inaequalis TaxID=5025 RepID=A0A8H3U7A9_VENIN|nr:hypothetical protein BLS_008296 [Venturia inaequalis]
MADTPSAVHTPTQIAYFENSTEREHAEAISSNHETLASVYRETIRKDAQMLQTMLPRELRDMVYKEMYAQDSPIHIRKRQPHENTQLGSVAVVDMIWPDPSGYLNHDLVGKEMSREAAEIFYNVNTFVIEDVELLSVFAKHDCYGYDVRPSSYIQSLVLALDNTPPLFLHTCESSPPENVEYIEGPKFCSSESESEESIQDKESNLWLHLRDTIKHNMEAVATFQNLKNLVIEVQLREIPSQYDEKGWWDPRDIANEVFRLKRACINLTIRTIRIPRTHDEKMLDRMDDQLVWQDVSSYFDEPTVTEIEHFEKHGPHGDSRSIHAEIMANYDENPLLEWPCLNNTINCRRHPGRDCTDQTWHDGWHRALIKDYWNKQQEFWDSFGKPSCPICEENMSA